MRRFYEFERIRVGRMRHPAKALSSLGSLNSQKEMSMSFTLPELPYAYDALQPYMSKETLEYQIGRASCRERVL